MEEQRNQTRIRCTLDLQLDRCCLDGTPWFLQRLPTELYLCVVWLGTKIGVEFFHLMWFEAHLFHKSGIQV